MSKLESYVAVLKRTDRYAGLSWLTVNCHVETPENPSYINCMKLL